MNVERKKGETETQYIWRIGQMIDSGQIGNWKEITPILNKELREDETEYRDESAYRKKYQYAKMFYDDIFSHRENDYEYIEELENLKTEIQKERTKLRDERTVKNRGIRVEARVEDKLDYLEEVIKEQGKIDYKPLKPAERQEVLNESNNDLIVMLTDLHIGQTFYSAFGNYDPEIAENRLTQYLNKIIEIKDRHNSENCFVTLQGDMISGSIH